MHDAQAAFRVLVQSLESLRDELEQALPNLQLAVRVLEQNCPRLTQPRLLFQSLLEWRQILHGATAEFQQLQQIAQTPSLWTSYSKLTQHSISPLCPVRFLNEYANRLDWELMMEQLYAETNEG